MISRFFVVLLQVLTLFLLIGTGFAAGKLKLVTAAGTGEMSALLLNVVVPCVVIHSFQTPCDPDTLRTLAVGAAALSLCYVIWTGVVQLFFRREEPSLRAPLRYGSMYANAGFMGLPLIQAVLGDEALIFAVVSMVVFNIFSFTLGAMMVGGRDAFTLRKVFLNPGVIAAAAGLPLLLTGITLPGPLYKAVGFIADLNTPMAMIIIGAQMARAGLASTFRNPKLYMASALKLFLMPAIAAAVLLPLGLEPLFFVSAVILAGAPTAAATSMFAERFGRDAERAAQLVSLSTLLSILTLPVLTVVAEALVR